MGVARSLDRARLLQRLVTTVALDPRTEGPPTGLSAKLRNKLRPLVRSRLVPSDLTAPVETLPFRELLRLAAVRAGLGDRSSHALWYWAETSFDRAVAKRWAGTVPCIYGCEHASLLTFREQKRLGGWNLLWQAIAHPQTVDRLLQEEFSNYPEALTPYQQLLRQTASSINARKEEQYALADLIVCNSEFSRQTFLDAGLPGDKVVAIPTGCPEPAGSTLPQRSARPLIFLCAGTHSIRKGVHYLLQAWREWSPAARDAELWLVGKMELPLRLLNNLPTSIHVTPPMSRTDLQRLYARASVLVLPSLAEGLAHVVPEACAAGMAVITTTHSGCTHLIEHGVTGWFVPIRDSNAIANRMVWCFDHPDELAAVQAKAFARVRTWTVADFATKHSELISNFLRRIQVIV
jgi:glycosyltransferase involved in cell wall biosynthesis